MERTTKICPRLFAPHFRRSFHFRQWRLFVHLETNEDHPWEIVPKCQARFASAEDYFEFALRSDREGGNNSGKVRGMALQRAASQNSQVCNNQGRVAPSNERLAHFGFRRRAQWREPWSYLVKHD